VRRTRPTAAALLAVLAFAVAAHAAGFQEARHGPASLAFVKGIPVVHVYGTPGQMGEQQGVLLREPIQALLEQYLGRFLGSGGLRTSVLKVARQMEKSIPARYVREMTALAKGAGVAYEDVLLANTVFDIKRAIFCSTVVAVGKRSADGKPIFGRNLDFPTFGVAHKYTCVVVYHPAKGRAVASVTFPGLIGVLSGLNDAGVAAATMEVRRRDTQLTATPYALVFRDALTGAAGTDDVVRIVTTRARTSSNNLMVCDAAGRAARAELGVKVTAVRRPEKGMLYSTNHFRSKRLGSPVICWRIARIRRAVADGRPLDVARTKHVLLRAAYPTMTMQSIVFRPASRAFLLAAGEPPAAKLPFVLFAKSVLFPAPARKPAH